MKTKYLAIAAISLLVGCKSVQKSTTSKRSPIVTKIDLTAVEDDKVPVSINPDRISRDTLVFRLPRVVPGTYAVSDFGRFIEDLTALDYEGNAMEVINKDVNTWVIPNATKFDKINYWVNDTYDQEGGQEEMPFSPSGTNIQPDAYVLNLHGFVGYFENKYDSYEIAVVSPDSLKRTSALPLLGVDYSEDKSVRTDRYLAQRYFDVTDNPMYYGELAIEAFEVGDMKIVLSVYSPSDKHKVKNIRENIEQMMAAQKAYLGSINSTERYDIILFLSGQGPGNPQGSGALEHHTSTVVVFPEFLSTEQLNEYMTDVVSHEFFHIVTPLSVHSEDVHYFDYNQPTFSKHLWMYEGITEYFANHFQVVEGLIDTEEFYSDMSAKVAFSTGPSMKQDMSFTIMSENILEEPYKSNFMNVYNKGALIGMCLDIILNKESNGKRNLLSLMKELSDKYGVSKPFQDDKIISEITAMTYPSVGEFLEKHVVGKTPIDYEKYLGWVGASLSEGKIKTGYVTNGNDLIIGGDMVKGLFFTDLVIKNSFWAEQGVEPNDVIKEWNGEKVTLQNANEVIGKAVSWQPGENITIVLQRGDDEIIIDTELTQSYTSGTLISNLENADSQQLENRKNWLSK